ncbi:ABC transporter substrate-binding protein [Microlunatus soli]|uniref:Carbohydrate ABC transporter substrate-binding protein, CUT1 family n=1 Tax=Microlunatus soli TaxID=630515 RepID=A0A1H1PSL1_9ACTN|nr:extracellular solute-binding protein [Microlunatus soli]SDS14150.1 carbohydrate ABC transporter substrate-binding protein, CUT1 family [Microlunatus soli]
MRIHKLIISSVLVTALAAVTGCSGAAPGGAPAAGDGSKQDSTVLRLNYGESQYAAAVLKAFQQEHPDIKVEVTHAAVTFEDGSVQTNLRSGHGADVLLVNSGPGRVAPLARAGLIADLTDVYDGGARQQYPKDVLDQITTDKKIYEVVEGRDIFELHYNQKILDRAGVQPPKTWSDLIASCKPLAEAGVQPLVVGARDNFAGGWLTGTLLQSSAGTATMRDVLFDNGSFAQQPVLDGAAKIGQLIKNGCLDGKKGLAFDGDQATATFARGKAAMIVATQALDADLQQDKVDTSALHAIPMPSDDPANAHPTSGLAVSWIVNANSRSLPAAKEWIRWVSSEKYLTIAAQNGYTFGPTHLVPDSVQLDPAIAKAVKDANTETGFNPSVYLSADGKDAWYAAVQGLLAGRDPKPLLQAIDTSRADGGE